MAGPPMCVSTISCSLRRLLAQR